MISKLNKSWKGDAGMNRTEIIKKQKERIEKELSNHGTWDNWYDELEDFRQDLSKHLLYESNKISLLDESKSLDHHVMGYFAPYDVEGIGFGGEHLKQYQQIIALKKQMEASGIDFIYISLPCKKAVYPEWFVSSANIPEDGIVIPQWRKFIYDLLDNDVLVFDLLPHFLEYKKEHPDKQLYTSGYHVWSHYAADITAKIVGKYLSVQRGSEEKYSFETVKGKLFETNIEYKKIYKEGNPNMQVMSDRKSDVALFGDCNLQLLYTAEDIFDQGIYFNRALSMYSNGDIDYLGRICLFSPRAHENLNMIELTSNLKNKKIAVHLAFSSAGFVRGDLWNKRKLPVFKEFDRKYLLNEYNLDLDAAKYKAEPVADVLRAIPDDQPIAVFVATKNEYELMYRYLSLLDDKNIKFILDYPGELTKSDKYSVFSKYTLVSNSNMAQASVKERISILVTFTDNGDHYNHISQFAERLKIEAVSPYMHVNNYMIDSKCFYMYEERHNARLCQYMHESELLNLIANGIRLYDYFCVLDYLKIYISNGFATIRNPDKLVADITKFAKEEPAVVNQQQYSEALDNIEAGYFYKGFSQIVDLYKNAGDSDRESLMSLLMDVFYYPNTDTLQDTYVKNCTAIKDYSYYFGEEIPDFDDLHIKVFPVEGNIYFSYDSINNAFTEIEINSERETKYFFKDLSKPLFVENETNEYNLEFLADNVRASEDVAMDNHIYLYYDKPDAFFSILQAFDFERLLESQKLIFLVGKNEKTVYPIDFSKKYNIDYKSMKPTPIRLSEMNRLCYWYKHAHSGSVLGVSTLSLNQDIVGGRDCYFHMTPFARSAAFKKAMMDTDTQISKDELCSFFSTDTAKAIRDAEGVGNVVTIEGALDFVKTTFPDKDAFTPTEIFKICFMLNYAKKGVSSRIVPLIIYDPHIWDQSLYETIMDSFKYLTVLTSYREPIVTFSRSFEKGIVVWDEFQTKYILMSDYVCAQFLNKKFYNKYYGYRFEDLKRDPKNMLKAICKLLNVPNDKKMMSVKASVTDRQGETVKGFDLSPLKRDMSSIFSEFDLMRLKIFYAPIHKYYGYDYFDADEHKLDDEDILKLFSYPFRFEISGYYRKYYGKSAPEASTLRKWLREALMQGYVVGKKGNYILPTLIKPQSGNDGR